MLLHAEVLDFSFITLGSMMFTSLKFYFDILFSTINSAAFYACQPWANYFAKYRYPHLENRDNNGIGSQIWGMNK